MIYIAVYVLVFTLIYYLLNEIKIYHKQKYIISTNKLYSTNVKGKFINSYVKKIESKLFNLGYPYKLTTKKYLIIKYLVSMIISIIAFINYNNIKASIIFYLIFFFTPNYLIKLYKNKEKAILINEIKNLVNSVILSLSAYSSLEQALSNSITTLTYKRFVEEYEKFVYEYKMVGYKLKEPAINLGKKFNSYELSLFLSTLTKGEQQGNLVENLIKFKETLELNYFKYLKKKTSERLMYVTLGTVLSLVDIILIVMYPIFMQVLNNLQTIFS